MKKQISLTYFKGAKGIIKEEFTGYNGARFFKDLYSGFTVSLTTLPLAVAVGVLIAGSVNPAFGALSGIISAIIAGIISAVLGGGPFQLSAPTFLTSAILSKIACGEFGLQGMLVATLFAGLILIICGFLKVGNVIKAIPKPTLNGLILGVTFIILVNRLPSLFGYLPTNASPVETVVDFFRNGIKNIDTVTIITGIITMTVIFIFPKKLNNVLPINIILIAVTTVLFYFSPLSTPVVGEIPKAIKNSIVLDIDHISFAMLKSIALPTIEIALLYIAQTLTCGARMQEITKTTYHPNIDLIGQGVGAVVSPILGGIHSAPDYSRSNLAVKSGATTRLSAIFQSLFLLLYVFAIPAVVANFPVCVVSAIIVVYAFKINDWKSIATYFKKRSWDSVTVLFVTAICAFTIGIFFAFIVGLLLTLIFMLFSLSSVEIYAELKKDLKTVGVTVTGPIFFGNIADFIVKMKAINCEYQRLIVNLSGVTFVDDTALDKMLEYFAELNNEKIVYFVSCKVKVLKKIARLKFYQSFGEDRFLDSFNDAYRKSIPSKKEKSEPIQINLSSNKNKEKVQENVLTEQNVTEIAEQPTEQKVVSEQNVISDKEIAIDNVTTNQDVAVADSDAINETNGEALNAEKPKPKKTAKTTSKQKAKRTSSREDTSNSKTKSNK